MRITHARKFFLSLAATGLLLAGWNNPIHAEGHAPKHEGGQHPLAPVLDYARGELKRIDQDVKGYSCTLIKRERVDGELLDREYLYAKVRHEPFSVYLYFLAPKEKKGNECIYIEGQNNNKLCAHAGSGAESLIGKINLHPEGRIAMRDNRYPITFFGFRTLVARLIEVGEHDMAYGECEVETFENAKINGRETTCIQVTHPIKRKEFKYNLARIFIDKEMQIPVRLTAYEWPTKEGGKPQLVEEYTYVNVKLNPGLTDEDFNYENEKYRFVRH